MSEPPVPEAPSAGQTPAPVRRRPTLKAAAQACILLAGLGAAVWLAVRALAPADCGCRRDARHTPEPRGSALVADFTALVADYRLGSREPSRTARDLSGHITALKTAGYTFLSASQVAEAVLKKSRLPARAVALTFRDDRRAPMRAALGAVVAHRVTATVFVAAPRIGRPHALTWADLSAYARDGVEFQPLIRARSGIGRAAQEVARLRRQRGLSDRTCVASAETGPGLSDAWARRIGASAVWGDTQGAVTPDAVALRLPVIRVGAGSSTRDLLWRLESTREKARSQTGSTANGGERSAQ